MITRRRLMGLVAAFGAALSVPWRPKEADAKSRLMRVYHGRPHVQLGTPLVLHPRPLDKDGLVRVPLNYWPGRLMVNGHIYDPGKMVELLSQHCDSKLNRGIVWDKEPGFYKTPEPTSLPLGVVEKVSFILNHKHPGSMRVVFLVDPVIEDGTQGALWLRDPRVFIATSIDAALARLHPLDKGLAWDCPSCSQRNAGWAMQCGRCERDRTEQMEVCLDDAKMVGLFATRDFPEYMRFTEA